MNTTSSLAYTLMIKSEVVLTFGVYGTLNAVWGPPMSDPALGQSQASDDFLWGC